MRNSGQSRPAKTTEPARLQRGEFSHYLLRVSQLFLGFKYQSSPGDTDCQVPSPARDCTLQHIGFLLARHAGHKLLLHMEIGYDSMHVIEHIA
jgi:hypothetical protein